MSDAPAIPTREELLRNLETQWNELQGFLASLTEDQLTRPADAAGWTVKDHVIHIAMWEKAALALLNGQPRREATGVPAEIWDIGEDDPNNAFMQERDRDMPLDEVMQTLRDVHAQVVRKLESMTEAELMLPYSRYNATSDDQRPLMQWMPWETYYHYRDHIPWMKAIAETA